MSNRKSGLGLRKMRFGRRSGAITVLVAGIVVLLALGPRPRVDETVTARPLPADLDSFVRDKESEIEDLRPGAESVLVWAGSPGTRTPLSVVYLHGFSATPRETRPLCDTVAARLGANLYYPLLTGHGRTGEAMASATANDWLNDTAEALEIGRRIGERVIVVGTSTGATLATWSAVVGDTSAVVAHILISPNFGPKDQRSGVLLWPWGSFIAGALVGKQRSWEPANELQAAFWTTSYPTRALLPMMALVQRVGDADLGRVTVPVQIVASPRDEVIDFAEAVGAFETFGSSRKRLTLIDNSTDGSHHVIAGDILSPTTTVPVADSIMAFLEPLVRLKRETHTF